MSSHLKFGLASAAALLAAALPAYAVQKPQPMDTPAAGATVNPSVIVFDQKLDGSAVKLTYVYVPKKSFAVVYGSDQKGIETGDPLGSIAVEAGDHRDLKIPLKGEAKSGAKLWISLYEDKDGNATFDKKGDVSYWASGELPLANSFVIR